MLRNEELECFYPKYLSDSVNHIDRRAINAPFQRTHIGAMDVCAMREFLLRKPLGVSQCPEIERKDLSNVHNSESARCSAFIYRVCSTIEVIGLLREAYCRCSRFCERMQGFVNSLQVLRTESFCRRLDIRDGDRGHSGFRKQVLSDRGRDHYPEPSCDLTTHVIRLPAGFARGESRRRCQPLRHFTQLFRCEFVRPRRSFNEQ